jgi:hypothetical protein
VSTSVEHFAGQTQIHERRSHARVLPRTLIYVACGESNGGMVLNVSADGLAISMAIPVGDEAYSNVHVRMNGLPQSIEVHGRMAWTTKSKKRAGIQLVDVSDEQRGQIREWLAQEGMRDVNLRPRVSELATSLVAALGGAAIIPKLLDEPRPDLSPVAASAAISPAVLPDPHVSLLAGLGGTAPESLGPAQDAQNESSFAEDTFTEKSSQGPNPNFARFRDEWDLASITMVPRKRSRPEGLSALGLLLLWIAIPSFGIGLIVGRRPLQQWLSQGGAMRKNIPHVATPESEIAGAHDESPDITGSDIDATGPQSIPTRDIETQANTSTQDVKTPAATKSFVSMPAVADTKLFNSMSTQELRTFRPASTAPRENLNATEPKVNSKSKADAVVRDVAVAKPATRFNISSASPNGPISKQNPSDQVARTIAVDSSVITGTTNYPGVAFSNAAAPHSSASTVTPTKVSRTTSSPAASTATVTGNSTVLQNTSGSTPSIQGADNASPASTVNNASRNNSTVLTASKPQPVSPPASTTTLSYAAATKPESRVTSDATLRIAPNVRPDMGSSATSGTAVKVAPNLYGSSSRSAAPSSAANLAPVNAQAPIHGVMLVARKNNESFLLRLPVESVANGRSVSVQIQRFVMVPPESRWHHHGPIAKLAVGELLTQAAANQLETASAARPGDAVTVRAFVDKNGSVEDLKPVSGRFALMPRVMHDVREWQFDQTLIDGKPVESEVNITVEFRSGLQRPATRSREIHAQNSFKP